METVIVAVHAIMDVDAVKVDALALNDANAVVRAVQQRDVTNCEVLALIDEDVVGALVATDAAGRRCTANSRMKLRALTVDRARPFDGDLFRFDCEEQRPVAVVQRRIAL